MRLLARDISVPYHREVLRSAAALILAAASSPILPAQAQDPYPDLDDIGLVMRVHTESVAPHLDEAGWNMMNAMLDPLYMLYNAIHGVTDADEATVLGHFGEPSPSEQDLLIRVKDDRMRVDIGTSALLARLDTLDRSVLEFGVLDPASGRVIDSDLFDKAVREHSGAPYDAMAGGGDNVTVLEAGDPIRTDELAQIAGHTARRYDFTHRVVITPLGTDETPYPTVHMERSIQAWIAEHGPYVSDPDAAVVSGQFTEGMPPELVQLTARGLVLGADDEVTITTAFWISGSSTAGGGSLEASSSFRVTSISREVVDDALLAGFEQERQACDCSCAAFERVKEISDDDNVLGTADCMQKCMPKWMRCINEVPIGGRCSVRPGHSI